MRSFLLIIDLVLPVSLLLLFELRCFCVFGVLCIVVLITNRFPHADIVRPYCVSPIQMTLHLAHTAHLQNQRMLRSRLLI